MVLVILNHDLSGFSMAFFWSWARTLITSSGLVTALVITPESKLAINFWSGVKLSFLSYPTIVVSSTWWLNFYSEIISFSNLLNIRYNHNTIFIQFRVKFLVADWKKRWLNFHSWEYRAQKIFILNTEWSTLNQHRNMNMIEYDVQWCTILVP